ncbi:WSC domain-containing protein [Psilocybe cubensis]|uniref:WSC domain-containing protein n=2 Tax=Psilocybe cubensis TaxID=181762 RepID=A0A8H8CHU9_PSICU|nr:WSC domain-containing protein [Psilocybe cubensis]KAH9479037.1 WSC domain-containing protein [Psilocybe cubensis]
MATANFLVLVSAALCVVASPTLDVRQSSTASLPSGWAPFGCYSDSTSSRTLRVASFTDITGMTVESCIAFCTPAGYNFAGLEFARECYCDNIIEPPAVVIDSSNCATPCTGNANEICGGSNAITIFQHTAASNPPTPTTTTTTTTTTPTPVASIKQSVGTFQYKGCFQDRPANQPRALGTQLTISGVTAETCTAACKAAGFALAGLEFGQECWCATFMSLVSPLPDSQCNMVCVADSTELCGAGNVLAVYQDTTATPLDQNTCLSLGILFPGAGGVPDFNFNLLMVPSSGTGTNVLLGVVFNTTIPINQSVFKLTGSLPQTSPGHSFSISGGQGAVGANSGGVDAGFSIPLIAGQAVLFDFVNFSTNICMKPNPIGSFGPFIGPPVLSVNGQANPWASCATEPLTPIFSPTAANGVCTSVFLEMLPPSIA